MQSRRGSSAMTIEGLQGYVCYGVGGGGGLDG
jgi:hypothetical protein